MRYYTLTTEPRLLVGKAVYEEWRTVEHDAQISGILFKVPKGRISLLDFVSLHTNGVCEVKVLKPKDECSFQDDPLRPRTREHLRSPLYHFPPPEFFKVTDTKERLYLRNTHLLTGETMVLRLELPFEIDDCVLALICKEKGD